MIIAGGLDWNLYLIEERNKTHMQDSQQNIIYVTNYQNNAAIKPDTKYLFYINELSQAEDLTNREKAFDLLEKVLTEETSRPTSDIEQRINNITGNDEKYILSILGRVVFGSKTSRLGGNSAVIRIKTASIAAKIGTAEAVSMLRNMLNAESDPVVISVLIKELGNVGSDPYGESVKLFQAAYSRFPNDLNIIENILMGVKNINKYQGYLYENEGKNLLFKMLEKTDKRDLKSKIIDVLKTLE